MESLSKSQAFVSGKKKKFKRHTDIKKPYEVFSISVFECHWSMNDINYQAIADLPNVRMAKTPIKAVHEGKLK